MITGYNLSLPTTGQVVRVRQRQYIVSSIDESSLPDEVLRTHTSWDNQHLVTLASIEDDGLGETLQVIWQLEPGTHIIERSTLPEAIGFDSPERLDAFLDAVRWGATVEANQKSLQSPFRSGIDLEDYQLDPLVRAVQMPRVSLLIADDVGLGKTVEAGLVIQELLVRNRARTILIVCPAGLQLHWRDQMRDKFGLEFRVVDSELMKRLRRDRGIHVNPWAHFPRLITSIDFLKQDTHFRKFRETLPADGEPRFPRTFDILIVDEAHNVAPSGRGKYAIDSLRTQAIRTISPHFEHRIFLSATPHNGYLESFTALLELLDNQRFARGVRPNRDQLDTIMVRRLKRDIKDKWEQPRFPERQLNVIEVDYTDEERQAHRWLRQYTDSRTRNAQSDTEKFATEFVLKLLKKRLFSSPEAFKTTLQKHEVTIRSTAEKVARKKAGPTIGILRRQIAQTDEDYADDENYEAANEGAVESASAAFTKLSHEEDTLLRNMRDWAERASAQRDSKTWAFVKWLRSVVKPDGKWNDERVIIFTEYRTTQLWLQTVLVAEQLGDGERLATIYGGMDDELREEIKAAFQAKPDDQNRLRILLATDAASEGIDLQNYCHRLVHIEIPWNPNRMEQRNGRIDRHGQRFNPQIYHFVTQGYAERTNGYDTVAADELDADLEFLMRAAEKINQIRADLGYGKVGQVIAQQVEEAMMGYRKHFDVSGAEKDADPVRQMLKFEKNVAKLVEEHMGRYYETMHDLNLSPENIRRAVEVALDLAGQQPLIPVEMEGGYYLPTLTGPWESAREGLLHPHTRVERPIVFNNELSRGRDDVVLAHLNHHLVQLSLRLLRAEIWSPETERRLYRVTARTVPNHVLDGPAAIAYGRLVIVGNDSHRLHEELIVAGGYINLRDGKSTFRRMNVSEVDSATEAMTNHPATPKVQENLMELWEGIRDGLELALERRAEGKQETLEKTLNERMTKEQENIETILRELERTIQNELKTDIYQLELPGFSDNEMDQVRRNVSALRARLEQIPNEIEHEQASIAMRFADPQPRLFPVAVTFLIPENMNR